MAKNDNAKYLWMFIALVVVAGMVWYFGFRNTEVVPPDPDPDVSISGQVLYLPYDGNFNAKVGNNGVVLGAPVLSSDSKVGSGSVAFNGQEGYVDAGVSSSYDMTTAVSISTWVKFNVIKQSYLVDKEGAYMLQLYVGADSPTPQFQGAVWYDDSVVKLRAGAAKTYQQIVTTGSMAVEVGKWYHVVYVYDQSTSGTNTVLYVNGQVAGTGVFSQNMLSQPTEKLKVGGKGVAGWDRNLNGLEDDTRVFNRAITQAEVTQLFAAGNGGKIPLSIIGPGNFE
jgi:hypothetical protein